MNTTKKTQHATIYSSPRGDIEVIRHHLNYLDRTGKQICHSEMVKLEIEAGDWLTKEMAIDLNNYIRGFDVAPDWLKQ